MRTKYNVCSKLWYDLNIDFVRKNIRHCCKATRDNETTLEELNRLGSKVFDFNMVTQFARQSMLVRDKLPHVCVDCIKQEPNSIRHVWNVWGDEYIDEIRPNLQKQTYMTNYIEFDLGPQCDLACVYCGPWSSTTWAKELGWKAKKQGIDTEWKDKVLSNLIRYISLMPEDTKLSFNILGGEPTLMPETYEIIDLIGTVCGHFKTKPVMMITTNLNTKGALMDRFIKSVEASKNVFKWSVAVSIEDIEERAEAIRYGLVWERMLENLTRVKEVADQVYLTTTFNNMNFPFFGEFIDWSFDVLGAEGYETSWMYSTNSVQDGYTDVAYLDPDQIDVDGIKQRLLQRVDNPGNSTAKMLQHLDNLKGRLGTKTVDEKFVAHWEDLSKRRSKDYLGIFPVIQEKINRWSNA